MLKLKQLRIRFSLVFFSICCLLFISPILAVKVDEVAASTNFHSRFETSSCPKLFHPEEVKALANARCGFLIVPENRSKANSPTIRLAVVILPALSREPASDPIVHLAGGPGSSAIVEAPYIIQAGLNRNHEVILLEQRGNLFSKPSLTCPEIDRFNARAVRLSYDADTTKRLHIAATKACYDRLRAKGIDLSAYNTIENMADFNDLRLVLKIPSWNVYAYSYGTYLALNLMRQYPTGIRTVILDSVLPPDLASLGWIWKSTYEGFHNLFKACENEPSCHAQYPNLEQTFATLIQKYEAKSLLVSVKLPSGKTQSIMIDGGALINWLVTARPPLTIIPSVITELAKGNPAKIASARAKIADPTLIGEFSHGLAYGVFCSEWIPYENPSQVLAEGKKVFPNYPDTVLEQAPQLPFLFDDCKVWQVPKAPALVHEVTRSTIPTLILSGSFDARTSPSGAAHVSQKLKNSTNVVIPGAGHWVTMKSRCAQHIIDSFLANPTSPDTSCANTLKPPRFDLNTIHSMSRKGNR